MDNTFSAFQSDPELVKRLELTANQVRIKIIRTLHKVGSGHSGGSLSAADMVTALYFNTMKIDPENPNWLERDRFILSKGHACPVVYVALAMRGYFPFKDLATLRQIDSHLQGHPDMRKTPGIDMTAGPLGCGLSAGVGMALGARVKGLSFRTYVMLGDGDLQEGLTWEGAMMAGHNHLSNLTTLIDYNRSQVDGTTDEVVTLEPLADKWRAFNWAVREIDGHNMTEVLDALAWAQSLPDQPTAVVAHTIKGKGVSFMENNIKWHGKAPGDKDAALALAELERYDGSSHA